MQTAKIINNKQTITKLSHIDRLYIGNDFCENNLNFLSISKLFSCYNNKKKITLILPFLTDKSFDKLSKLLNENKNINLKTFEIVFNDWGTFYYLRKYYPAIKLVLGRLLSKQRKDPRIDVILQNKQDKFKFLKSDDKIKIVKTKKIPNTLKDLFCRHSVETKEFFDFLTDNSVYRIEIDNLMTDMFSNLPDNIKVSLYYPYILLTLTRYCGALNGEYINVCNKNCRKKPHIFNDNFYINGNALYFKNLVIPGKLNLMKNNINRIVYQDL